MSEKRQIVVLQTGKSAKIVKWKVKTGMVVTAGCVILLYETHPSSGEAGQQKLKSSSVGTVKTLLAKEGDIIKPGEPLFEVEKCTHPTIMKDMCAECGADLRNEEGEGNPQAGSIPMVHSIPELKVNEEQAQIIGKADEERLLSERKLVLLVDLDQTLIHTTNDNIPANLKDVYHFQLHGARSPWYHTRLRPGTGKFLTEMSKIYELHICTFGSRTYAHMIAMFLDPDGKFFSHRILSRDECFSANCKTANLKALFPCGDSLVCIIDDREDVWSFVPNLIHVKPYHFFQHTGDINAPPGLSKRENDDVADYDFNCLGDGQKHENEAGGDTAEVAPKEKNKKGNYGENRSSSIKEEPITGDEDSTDFNQEKFSQALKIEPKDDAGQEGENRPLDEKNEGEVYSSKDKTTQSNEVPLELEVKAKNEIQAEPNEKEAKPDNMECLDASERSDHIEGKSGGTVKVSKNSDGTVEVNKNSDGTVEVNKNSDGTVEVNKNSDGTVEVNENSDGAVTSGEAEVSVEDGKTGEVKDHVEGRVEKSGAAEKAVEVNSCGAEKSKKSSESDTSNTNNLDRTPNGTEEDKEMENRENGPTNVENIENTTRGTVKESTQGGQPIQTVTGGIPVTVGDSDEIDVQDADDYLLYLEEILKSIHKEFYLRKDAGDQPDLKQIVPEIKARVLKGTSLVFSGLVPNHIQLEYSRAYQVAVSLGASVTQDLIKGTTTHLVAVRPGTAKVNSARRMRNIFVVTADWLWTCAERWERVDEKVFPLGKNKAGTRHPPAHCSPEHPPPETQIQPAVRTRSPSGRFMDTINPLLSFSLADIADMDQEVEDIFNESESDGEDDGPEGETGADGKDRPSKPNRRRKRNQQENPSGADNPKAIKRLKQVPPEVESESSSSSADSLSGEHPRGWRQHELRREARAPAGTGTESDPEEDLEESPSSKFRRGEALPSDLDLGEDESASQGSDEPPDEVDDGDWNMMGAALEREFLS